MSSATIHHIFVYGTLKKGQPNHDVMTDPYNGRATFVSYAQTVSKYPLVIASAANVPSVLFQEEGTGHNIFGEIWAVDDKMRECLDDFEGYPSYYQRHQIPVVSVSNDTDNACTPKSADGEARICWIYTVRQYDSNVLESQFYSNYDSYGEHGMPYKKELDDDPDYESVDF